MVRREILYTKRESNFFTFSSGMAQMHDQLYWQFLSPSSQNWHSFDSHINSAVSPMWDDWYIIIASSQKLVQSWWERFQLLMKGSTKMRTTHAESLFLKFYPVSCDYVHETSEWKATGTDEHCHNLHWSKEGTVSLCQEKKCKEKRKTGRFFHIAPTRYRAGYAKYCRMPMIFQPNFLSVRLFSHWVSHIPVPNLKNFENGMRNKKISNITFASSTF